MLLKFLRDRRGNILPTFALLIVPLLVSTGAVVDYTNAYDQRSLVQDALDSAALAAGKQVGLMSTEQLKAEAEAFYLANVGTGKISNVPSITTEIQGSTVDVNTTLHVPTYFLGLIGLNEFVFDLHTQVTVAMGTLEIAMVLDNSTSMVTPDTTKIATLKTAASSLVNTIYGLGATSTKPDPVKIGLVPFAGAVNIGPSADWVDKLGKGTYAGQAQKDEGAAASLNPYALFDGLKDASGNAIAWGGCVEERPGDYAVNDEPPSTAANPSTEEKKTLFVPMFAPDESDGWNCSTSTCNFIGSGSNRRFNGVPTSGNQAYNNYLPDVGASGGACGTEIVSSGVSISRASPAVVTKNGHALTAGTAIVFNTTGSLYSGLTAGTAYYVAPVTTSNTFTLTTMSSGTTVTVTPGSAVNFTVTKANPAVFTSSSHGLTAGTAIKLQTTGSMYSPLSSGSTYYVRSQSLQTSSFTVSTSSGGSAVNTSNGGSQSGTHSYVRETVFTKNSHGLAVNDPIVFTTTGSLPTGISVNTVYYVRTVPTNNTFTISATSGGTPIFASGSQSGTHSFFELLTTTGSQSGTHSYFPAAQTANWTCENGNDNCGSNPSGGRSQQKALAGINISGNQQCKYGTSANKATVPNLTVGNIKGGPNFMCTTTPVTPLTTSQQTVLNAITAQEANGYTNITSGIMWGWRLLSPGAPFTEGRSYEDNENQKILIVMTDGENTYNPYLQANQNPSTSSTPSGKFVKSSYGAWGYVYKGRFGTTSTTSSTIFTNLNAQTAAACVNAKAANIRIYTIAFKVTDAATVSMLRDCASDPTMAFKSDDNSALIAAFNAIGDDLSLLRIAM